MGVKPTTPGSDRCCSPTELQDQMGAGYQDGNLQQTEYISERVTSKIWPLITNKHRYWFTAPVTRRVTNIKTMDVGSGESLDLPYIFTGFGAKACHLACQLKKICQLVFMGKSAS